MTPSLTEQLEAVTQCLRAYASDDAYFETLAPLAFEEGSLTAAQALLLLPSVIARVKEMERVYDYLQARDALPATHEPQTIDMRRLKDLLTLIRCGLERKFQTSDYLPDRWVEPHTARPLITDACAEFMEHQRTIHDNAEKALMTLEAGMDVPPIRPTQGDV